MVNVTHYYNNGVSCLKISIVILCGVDDSVLNCNNNLFVNLCAKLGCNDFCRIKVKHIVDGCHLAEHKELFDNLCRCNFELESKVVYGDFLRDSYRDLLACTLCSNSLESLCFSLAAVGTCTLLAVLLGFLAELLLAYGRILHTL